MSMTKVQIQLDKVSDIKRLVETVGKMNNIIDAVQGRHCIDAKSFLGILSLDIEKPIELHIHGDVNKAFMYNLENLNEQD